KGGRPASACTNCKLKKRHCDGDGVRKCRYVNLSSMQLWFKNHFLVSGSTWEYVMLHKQTLRVFFCQILDSLACSDEPCSIIFHRHCAQRQESCSYASTEPRPAKCDSSRVGARRPAGSHGSTAERVARCCPDTVGPTRRPRLS
ncbi:unnamed protein product, partial [Choristocarpus tenellus]